MPCDSMAGYNSGDAAMSQAHKMRGEVDTVTWLLCALLRERDADGTPIRDPELRAWWDAHKAHDARRKAGKVRR